MSRGGTFNRSGRSGKGRPYRSLQVAGRCHPVEPLASPGERRRPRGDCGRRFSVWSRRGKAPWERSWTRSSRRLPAGRGYTGSPRRPCSDPELSTPARGLDRRRPGAGRRDKGGTRLGNSCTRSGCRGLAAGCAGPHAHRACDARPRRGPPGADGGRAPRPGERSHLTRPSSPAITIGCRRRARASSPLPPGPSPDRWLACDDSGPLLVSLANAPRRLLELSTAPAWRHQLALALAGPAGEGHAHVPLILCHQAPAPRPSRSHGAMPPSSRAGTRAHGSSRHRGSAGSGGHRTRA